jgi:hypothetical protein
MCAWDSSLIPSHIWLGDGAYLKEGTIDCEGHRLLAPSCPDKLQVGYLPFLAGIGPS